MRAIIVAAGQSSRLYPLTSNLPKCMLEIGGKSIIKRQIDALNHNKVKEITVVTGYKQDLLKDHLKDSNVNIVPNPFYMHCNNMGSLWFGLTEECKTKEEEEEEVLVYLHSDVVFDESILSDAINSYKTSDKNTLITLVTDFNKELNEEAMKVKITKEGYLLESSKDIPISQAQGEWIGLGFISNPNELKNLIERHLFLKSLDDYDTAVFNFIAKENSKSVFVSPSKNSRWLEIDFLEEYNLAKKVFSLSK